MARIVTTQLSAALAPFELDLRTALSAPTPLQRERWKYTRQTKVIALLDGIFTPDKVPTSPSAETPSKSVPESVPQPIKALGTLPDLNRLLKETAPAAYALTQNSILHTISLSDAEAYTAPTDVPFQATQIRVEEGCTATIEEIYESAQALCRLVWIELAPGASLTHSRNFMSNAEQWHYLHVTIGKDATYTLNNHTLGAALQRQDILVDVSGPGAHAELTGSAVVGPKQHLDQQVRLQHVAANATSKQTFHSIAGERANVTFGGRIHIHEGCDGTDAQLQNRNLALADNATVNTKPELEIYAEDVKCAHGATVGQLDESQMFYCLSRGIDLANARALLSNAFIKTATTGALADHALDHYSSALQ